MKKSVRRAILVVAVLGLASVATTKSAKAAGWGVSVTAGYPGYYARSPGYAYGYRAYAPPRYYGSFYPPRRVVGYPGFYGPPVPYRHHHRYCY